MESHGTLQNPRESNHPKESYDILWNSAESYVWDSMEPYENPWNRIESCGILRSPMECYAIS